MLTTNDQKVDLKKAKDGFGRTGLDMEPLVGQFDNAKPAVSISRGFLPTC